MLQYLFFYKGDLSKETYTESKTYTELKTYTESKTYTKSFHGLETSQHIIFVVPTSIHSLAFTTISVQHTPTLCGFFPEK